MLRLPNSFSGQCRTKTLLLTVLLLGLFLRMHNLGVYPLGYDEATAALENRGIFSLPALTEFFNPRLSLERHDYLICYNHAFLYYWKKAFGENEFNLRISSVIFGMLGLFAVYLLGRAAFNEKVALISVFFLSVSPLHIFYSQELRPYVALFFFATLSFYALLKLKKNKPKYWVIYTLANAVSVYLHYMMLLILAAEFLCLAAEFRKDRDILGRAVLFHGLIFLIVLPVVIIVIPNVIFILTHTIKTTVSEFPIWAEKVTLANILFTLKNFAIGYSVNFYSVAGISATFIALAMFVRGCYADKPRVLPRLMLFVFPFAVLFVISRFIKVCYVDRYLFPLLPVYILYISNGIFSLKKANACLAVLFLLLLTGNGIISQYRGLLPQDYSQHIGVPPRCAGLREAAKFIFLNYRNGDKICVNSKLLVFPLKFYFNVFLQTGNGTQPGPLGNEVMEGKVIAVDSSGNLVSALYKEMRPNPIGNYEFVSLKGAKRLWLLNYLFDSKQEIIEKIEGSFIKGKKFEFDGMEVLLYEAQLPMPG